MQATDAFKYSKNRAALHVGPLIEQACGPLHSDAAAEAAPVPPAATTMAPAPGSAPATA